MTRIYRTIGIVPWYFLPGPEMEALDIWARGPVAAVWVAYEGIRDLAEDIVMLCASSARVHWAAWSIQLKKRFKRVSLKVDESQLAKAGLPRDFTTGVWEGGKEREAFVDNILRNVGRRVYRTEKGFVGMGPTHVRAVDAVAVFHGGTMAHVLRRCEDEDQDEDEDEDATWEYVGEAYCDGIMDGEAMERGTARRFVLA